MPLLGNELLLSILLVSKLLEITLLQKQQHIFGKCIVKKYTAGVTSY